MAASTLTGVLSQIAEAFPSRRAISASGKFDLTHAQLHRLVLRAAEGIRAAGVNPGDVVALTFPNTVEASDNHALFFVFPGTNYDVDASDLEQRRMLSVLCGVSSPSQKL